MGMIGIVCKKCGHGGFKAPCDICGASFSEILGHTETEPTGKELIEKAKSGWNSESTCYQLATRLESALDKIEELESDIKDLVDVI